VAGMTAKVGNATMVQHCQRIQLDQKGATPQLGTAGVYIVGRRQTPSVCGLHN
jgi:hypothetical protein